MKSKSASVPFYRRLRFSMMLTVLVLVTLISGASILISYYVTGKKIERDVSTEFLNTERVIATSFDFFNELLLLTAKAAANEFAFRRLHHTETQSSPAEIFHSLDLKGEVDFFFLMNSIGEVVSSSEKGSEQVRTFSTSLVLQKKLGTGRPFTAIVSEDAAPGGKGSGIRRKRFFLVAAVPIASRQTEENLFVLCAYLMDSSFLLRFPIDSHMDVTLVSDNTVVASTLPPEHTDREEHDYASCRSSVLLPGPTDLTHESSFFKEKTYIRIKYIPGLENSTTDFMLLHRRV